MRRDFGEHWEATVVHLLAPAGVVEPDDLHEHRVVEIRHGRVIERQVAVLADTEADEVDRRRRQQGRVARARDGGRQLGRQRVERADRDMVEQVGPQVAPETSRVVGLEADVVIHVEGRHAGPVEAELRRPRGRDQRGEELVLRRRAGEDDARGALRGQSLAQVRGHGVRGRLAQRRPVGVDDHRQTAGQQAARRAHLPVAAFTF